MKSSKVSLGIQFSHKSRKDASLLALPRRSHCMGEDDDVFLLDERVSLGPAGSVGRDTPFQTTSPRSII